MHNFHFSRFEKYIQVYDAPLYSHSIDAIYSSDRINLIKSQFELLQQFTGNECRSVHIRINKT